MANAKPADDVDRYSEITDIVCERLAKNQRVRRTLPGKGRLRFDRQLPFLCVYRTPIGNDDLGTRELVTSQAAYLFASGNEAIHEGVSELCQRVNAVMLEHFGAFLTIEVWSQPNAENIGECENLPWLQPAFEIVVNDQKNLADTVQTLSEALSKVRISEHNAQVMVRSSAQVAPPGLPLLNNGRPDSTEADNFTIGLAVRPIFRDAETGTLFPRVLHSLRAQIAKAIRKGIAEFAETESTGENSHFDLLGPSTLVKAARLVDQELCEVSGSFDFLLQATPINADEAWEQFEEVGFQTEPALIYRPLPYDPNLLKRRLFAIEIERIEDPTLAELFWEQQEEIDRQLTALRDLNTPNFLYSSLQLYGEADDALVKIAQDVLARFPSPEPSRESNGYVDTKQFVDRAREEIDHYHSKLSGFNATVEICDHIAAGVMVSQDKLLVSDTIKIRADRVEPLLHHEIGTHLVTYFNGRCQPIRQLYAGLAGYDELQEGLAVLAEYLSGGLTPNRLRNLAGRVIAVRMMTEGHSFVETFERLYEQCKFAARQAFTTTLRVFRGGGLTKDVIYLRGLSDVLDYLAEGHDIEPLYVGKVGLQHLPYIQEMRRRGIIKAPGVLPRFWDDPDLRERLETCRGLSILELLETEK